MEFQNSRIAIRAILATCVLLGCSDQQIPPSRSEATERQRTTTPAQEHRDDAEKIIPEAIKRTVALYLGPEDRWPVSVLISPHGEIPITQCGPTPAGYCKTDNTIAFSSDFMLEATTKSAQAIPFIVGHEIAHAFIMNRGVPPKNPVLHELAADCLSGKMMVNVFNIESVESEEQHSDLAKFTHSIGDPHYQSIDHHGFGSQRYIAYMVGYTAATLAKNGDKSHENDCTLIFAN